MSKGPTLADVCRMAAERGVGIRIFVQTEHVGQFPPLVTIQVAIPNKPHLSRAFYSRITEAHGNLNETLGMELGRYVDMVKDSDSGLIIVK